MENQSGLIYCNTEYDSLKRVIVAPPKYMKITEIINLTQKHYAEENINIDLAMKQFDNFINILREEGAIVEELTPKEELNEQVFTRDIGFVIGGQLFVSYMNKAIRQKEVPVLMDWLDAENLPYTKLNLPSIEGGDVIIDGKQIWAAVSGRTSLEAIKDLQKALPDHEIITITLHEEILHLDCVFNIISKDTALLYSDAIDEESLAKIEKKYKVIKVTKEEQFLMGPNVLAIGGNKLISLPENKRLNNELKNAGFEIIEVPFSEIIKSGGSYRCCTLPLVRS